MALLSPSTLPELSDRILCYYVNSTSQLQKARISNVPNWAFERVVFPSQRFLFDAIPNALLEIYTCSPLGETPCKQIPCNHLKVYEDSERGLTAHPNSFEHPAQTELVKE